MRTSAAGMTTGAPNITSSMSCATSATRAGRRRFAAGMAARIDPLLVPTVAFQQRGVFTRTQALADGFTRRQVDHRITRGLWTRTVGRGLVLGSTEIDAWVLAVSAWVTRPGCIILGKVAAALHGVRVPLDGTVEIWTDAPGDRGPLGIQPRRVRLDTSDVVEVMAVDGTPGRIARRERACADLFRWEPTVQARNALAWARSRELITGDELLADVAGQPRTRGNPQARRFADHCSTGAMSVDEERAHELLRTHGFTGWEADVPLPDARRPVARADIYFAEARLDVEIDRVETHGARFYEDRERDNRLLAHGIAVHRITSIDIEERPREVAVALRRTLAALTGRASSLDS